MEYDDSLVDNKIKKQLLKTKREGEDTLYQEMKPEKSQ